MKFMNTKKYKYKKVNNSMPKKVFRAQFRGVINI